MISLGKKKGELRSLILLSPREGLTWRYRDLSPNVEREFRGHRNFLSLHITLLKNQAEGFPSLHSHFLLISPHDFDPKHLFKKKHEKVFMQKYVYWYTFHSLQDNFHLSVWPICWDLKRGRFKASLSLKHCRFHAVGFHLLTCRLRRLRSVLPTWQSLGWVV